MFTGIIEEIGTVTAINKGSRSFRLHISAHRVIEDLKTGGSVAVNGVCLTADGFFHGGFIADVMPETMERTALGTIKPGTPVNLERAMPADGRFGGHIVSGHIDGTGTVRAITRDDNAVRLRISAPAKLLALMIDQGSVAVDGVSLTIVAAADNSFTLSLIPHTAGKTTLLHRRCGDPVNIECDMLGKYIQKFLSAPFAGHQSTTSSQHGSAGANRLTAAFLREHGF